MEQKSDKSLLKRNKANQTDNKAGGSSASAKKHGDKKAGGGKVAPMSPSRARLERHANDEKLIRNIKIAFTSIVVLAIIAVAVSVFLFFYKPMVATVAGAGITQYEFTYNLMAASGNVDDYNGGMAVAQTAFDSAAVMKMQEVLAKENGFSLTNDDKASIKEEMDYVDEQALTSGSSSSTGGPITTDEYLRQKYGVNTSQFKNIFKSILLINNFLQDKYDQVEVSDENAQAQYDVDADTYREATVRHILFMSANGDEENPRTDEDAKKLAEDTLARINAGEDMAELVQELSEDNDLTNEGIYTIKPTDGYEPGFLDWTFDSERTIGETGICETSYGYHVMRLEDMVAIPFEDVKDTIIDAIKKDSLNNMINEWKKEPRFDPKINQNVYDAVVMQVLGNP